MRVFGDPLHQYTSDHRLGWHVPLLVSSVLFTWTSGQHTSTRGQQRLFSSLLLFFLLQNVSPWNKKKKNYNWFAPAVVTVKGEYCNSHCVGKTTLSNYANALHLIYQQRWGRTITVILYLQMLLSKLVYSQRCDSHTNFHNSWCWWFSLSLPLQTNLDASNLIKLCRISFPSISKPQSEWIKSTKRAFRLGRPIIELIMAWSNMQYHCKWRVKPFLLDGKLQWQEA